MNLKTNIDLYIYKTQSFIFVILTFVEKLHLHWFNGLPCRLFVLYFVVTSFDKDRAGCIKGATMEIKSIIQEFQMQALGGMRAAWDLWEKCPYSQSIKWFWHMVHEVPDGCRFMWWSKKIIWRVMFTVPKFCSNLSPK